MEQEVVEHLLVITIRLICSRLNAAQKVGDRWKGEMKSKETLVQTTGCYVENYPDVMGPLGDLEIRDQASHSTHFKIALCPEFPNFVSNESCI